METVKIEPDPDGLTQQVAVIMTGKVYRDAGLKHSKHPKVEGLLYDKLCQIGKHKLRDDVRRMAYSIAISVRDKEFTPTVAWLDNFMRRFCLSKKKMGFHSTAMLKVKPSAKPEATAVSTEKGVSQEEVFSALGFPKDFTGLNDTVDNLESGIENGGGSAGETTNGKASAENGISGDITTKGENGVDIPVDGDEDGETDNAQKEATNGKTDKDCEDSVCENKDGDKSLTEVEEVDPLAIPEEDPLEIKNEKEDPVEIKTENFEPTTVKTETEEKKESPDVKKEKNDNEANTSNGADNEIIEINEENDSSNGEEKVEEDSSNGSDTVHNKKERSYSYVKDDSPKKNTSSIIVLSDSSGTNDEYNSEDDEDDKKEKPKLTEAEETERKKSKQEEDEEFIEYSKEEHRYFRKNIEALQKRLSMNVVRCASCFEQVNHQLRNLVHTHPVLGIFICKRCRKYYGKGKFCKDDDGYDEYCRLCAEGGDLLCCEQEGCFNGFCKRCIKRVLGRSELKNAEKSKKWACYVCDRTPMMELRGLHRAILNNLKDEEDQNNSLSRKEAKDKEIRTKFALLKRNRLEKAKKTTPEKSKSSPKKKIAAKAEPWLKDIIDNFTKMLQVCLNNVDKISDVWAKYDYSKEGTVKTGKRILKQLKAMNINFNLMENDVCCELEKVTSETSGKEKEGASSQDIAMEDLDMMECSQEAGTSNQVEKEYSDDAKEKGDKTKKLEKEKKSEKKEKSDARKNAASDEEKESDKKKKGKGTPKISNDKKDNESDEEKDEEKESDDKKKGKGTPKKSQDKDDSESDEEKESDDIKKKGKGTPKKSEDKNDNEGDEEKDVDTVTKRRGRSRNESDEEKDVDDSVAKRRRKSRKESDEEKDDDSVTRRRGRSKKESDDEKDDSVTRRGGRSKKESDEEKDDSVTKIRGSAKKESNEEKDDESVTKRRGRSKKESDEEKDDESVTKRRGRSKKESDEKDDDDPGTQRRGRSRKSDIGKDSVGDKSVDKKETDNAEENDSLEVKKKDKPKKSGTENLASDDKKDDKDDSEVKRSSGRLKKKVTDGDECESSEEQAEKDSKDEEEEEDGVGNSDNDVPESDNCSMDVDNDSQDSSKAPLRSPGNSVKMSDSETRTSKGGDATVEDEVDQDVELSNTKGNRRSSRKGGASKDMDDETDTPKKGNNKNKSDKDNKKTDKSCDEDDDEDDSNNVSESDKKSRKSGRLLAKGKDDDEDENINKKETPSKKTTKGKESKNKKDDVNNEDEEKGTSEEEKKAKPERKMSISKRRSSRNQVEEHDDEMKEETEEIGDKGKKIKKEKIKKEDESIKEEDKSSQIKEEKNIKKEKDDASTKEVKIEKKSIKKEKENKKRKRKDDDDEAEEKKQVRKRSKRRRSEDDDSDDSLLGIGSDSDDDDTAEENTDDEVMRRRKEHTIKSKPRKKKNVKKKQQQQEDSSEDEDDDKANEGKKSKEKTGDPPKKKGKEENKISKKNKEALSSLLASDSDDQEKDQEDDDEGEEDKSKKEKLKKSEVSKTAVSESSDTDDDSDETTTKDKKVKDKNKDKKSISKPTDDNAKAKDALLESESDDDLEDKPKPKCKKKNYKEPRACVSGESRKQRLIRAQRKKLLEEEREELKKQHLKSKVTVHIEKLSSTVLETLEEEECIDVKEHSELDYDQTEQDQATYDGDAEEEDESDQEFSKLMKFNVNKKFCKPAPKSKKKLLTQDEEEEEEEEEEGEKDDDGEKKEDKEGKEKKGVKTKKEGLLDISIDKDDQDDDDDDEDEFETFGKKKKKKEGGFTLNEKLKKNLLLSSDEDDDDEEEEEEEEKGNPDEEEKERKKHELRKKKKKEEEEEETKNEEESEGEYAPRVHKKGYVKLDITSDEDDEDFKESKEVVDVDDDDDDDDDDSDFEESPRKRRTFQISSSDSDSDGGGKKKKKRKKDDDSSYTESEDDEEDSSKNKRKRIKNVSSSSDEGDEEEEENEEGKDKDDSPSKHKKIRRVIRDEDLLETTKNATQEEEERRRRIAERQKKFNQIFEIDVESDQKDLGKLVLDFDPETKDELVRVHEKLVKSLKPHQFKGIKFMWDSTIESIEMLEKKRGSGCILAHCMGLGKTLQVIAYVHTLMTNRNTSQLVQRVMVCCPVNTVYNWVQEFNTWLKGKMLPFEVSELVSAKDLWGRAYRLDDWFREGGVCIMGYDMYRNLSNAKNKRYKGKMKEIFQKSLVEPGPDVIVCDEGHLLKNEKTALSIAINKIKTQRRIVLTGTPLQNNLKEYHCMIQFVKPNLLGTKKEFMNRFVNPIEQGQCADAQPRDVRRMKRRAHILHNMLEGCVQRFDYTVLKPFLPPKFEYVISIQLSDIQIKLYQYYLDNLAQGGPKRHGSGLFVDYGQLSRVWTHPKVLELAVRRALLQDNDDDDLEDFICDDTSTDESSEDERPKKKKKKDTKVKDKGDDDEIIEENEVDNAETAPPGPIPGLTADGKVRVDWWKKILMENISENFEEEGYLDKLEHSGKLILLLEVLRESCSIGDKVLVFSQSLLALDMMEEFLGMIDQGEVELPEPEDDPLPMPFKKWKKDRDYFRLDGSTNPDMRKQMCKSFNNVTNERCRLFLISTRAGGLGINLVAANRVIVFDSSWNPSHDSQSIFRVYRFGQKKPCYVYRFVAQGTMEEKIYSRQVAKMSTALRVVDEHQIKRYFKMDELAQLYEFTPADVETRETPAVPEDRLLAELLKRQKDWLVSYHEHDSLLENQTSEELSEEERKAAWEDYENEKKGLFVQNQRNSVMPVVGNMGMPAQSGLPSLSLASFSFEGVVNTIKAQNPNLSQNDLCESVVLATKQIQRIHLNHYQRVQGMVYNLKNPMIAPEQRKLLPFGNHPEMLPMLEQQLRLLEDNIQRENQVINHMTSITPQRKDSYSSMMSAGLVRGQPASNETNSSSANYVGRSMVLPTSSTSTATTSGSSQTKEQENPPAKKKKDGSGDVIMLD